MRRKDREVTDQNVVAEIISACNTCRIGMVDNGRAYVVPMSFGFTYDNGVFEIYFHGATEGKKIDLLKQSTSVCLEFDTGQSLIEAELAHNYSTYYRSVIAYGRVVFLEGPQKSQGLDVLMSQYSTRTDFTYPEATLQRMAVYKVIIEEITAKEHQ